MPLYHCKKCHHEWEGTGHEHCDWCGAEGKIIQEETHFEKFMKDAFETIEGRWTLKPKYRWWEKK